MRGDCSSLFVIKVENIKHGIKTDGLFFRSDDDEDLSICSHINENVHYRERRDYGIINHHKKPTTEL